MAIIDSEFFRDGNFLSFLNPRNWQWTRDRFFTPRTVYATTYGTDTPTIEIDCEDAMTAYLDCPHLRAAVDKKAEMFANGEWKCVDVNDEEKEYPDDPGLAILNNPNPLESREDFLFKASFFKSLLSSNFMYPVRGSVLVLPKAIWHLPSDMMKIKMKNMNSFFDQTEISQVIDKFILCYNGMEKKYDPKEIIYKAENFSFKDGKGLSKIPSLKLPVNNLVASLKTRNVLTVNFGAKGITCADGKDVVGPTAIKAEDKKAIEEQLASDSNLYSSASKMKISSSPIKFVQISGNMNDMKLTEGETADFMSICAVLGMKKDIFPFVEGSTYENQREAEKGTYQSTIMQDADSFAGIMTKALNPGKNRKYILSYDWLPVMQEDEKSKQEADNIKAKKNEILYLNGIISAEDFAASMGVAMTGDGQIKRRATSATADPTASPAN